MDRRDFLKTPILPGAFSALYAGAAAAQAQAGGTAGHLTMTALAGDCTRLAMCSGAVSTEVKDVLARNPELVRIGGLVRLPEADVPGLLDALRGKKGSDRELALVFGSLIERAVGPFKPNLKTDAECDLYRDVTLLREMAWPRGGANRATAAEVYDLLVTLETRRLMGIHTFSPDSGDVDRWLGALIKWRRDCRSLFRRYAEVFCNPDPELTRKHAGPSFYSRQDGVIALARAVQNGLVISRAAVAPALKAAASSSQYAQALRRGHDFLAAASAFSAGSIDAAALLKRLGDG